MEIVRPDKLPWFKIEKAVTQLSSKCKNAPQPLYLLGQTELQGVTRFHQNSHEPDNGCKITECLPGAELKIKHQSMFCNSQVLYVQTSPD